jgi:rhodanese-related sulfurtransferase
MQNPHRQLSRPTLPARAIARSTQALAVLALLVAVASGCSSSDGGDETATGGATDSAAATASFERVSVADIHGAVSSGDALLVDVREQQEWDAGHAAEAVHIPLGEIERRLDEVRDAAKGRPVVIICRSGNRSQQAAQIAVSGGIADVSSVDGGMGDWVAAGHPIVPEDGTII